MSVSKWAYEPDKCDGDFCIGECDRCGKAVLIVMERNKAARDACLFKRGWELGWKAGVEETRKLINASFDALMEDM